MFLFHLFCAQLFQHPAGVRRDGMKSFQLRTGIIGAGSACANLFLHAAGPDAADATVTEKPSVHFQTTVTDCVPRLDVQTVLRRPSLCHSLPGLVIVGLCRQIHRTLPANNAALSNHRFHYTSCAYLIICQL